MRELNIKSNVYFDKVNEPECIALAPLHALFSGLFFMPSCRCRFCGLSPFAATFLHLLTSNSQLYFAFWGVHGHAEEEYVFKLECYSWAFMPTYMSLCERQMFAYSLLFSKLLRLCCRQLDSGRCLFAIRQHNSCARHMPFDVRLCKFPPSFHTCSIQSICTNERQETRIYARILLSLLVVSGMFPFFLRLRHASSRWGL